MEILVSFILFMCGVVFVSCDVYSSTAHLEDVLNYVKKVNISEWITQHFVRPEETRLQNIKNKLRFSDTIDTLLDDDHFQPEHPLYVYKLFRHLARFETQMMVSPSDKLDPASKFNFRVLKLYLDRLPTGEDLSGCAVGIARLQTIYQLPITDLMNGTINGRFSRQLTTAEALDIVTYTNELNVVIPGMCLNNYTLSWLIHINNMRLSYEKNKLLQTNVLRLMSKIYIKAKCVCSSELRHIYDTLSQLEGRHAVIMKQFAKNCTTVYNAKYCKLLNSKNRMSDSYARYFAMCRGDHVELSADIASFKTPEHRLTCMLQHNNDPRLIFQPIKVEILNMKAPFIAILHDIVTDKEIKYMKKTARPHLRRGTVRQIDGQVKSDNKISKTMLLSNNIVKQPDKLQYFRSRLIALTRLNPKSFETIQVANYGVGGVYNLHVDFVFPRVKANFSDTTNNRLLSVVHYLSDVTGGMTVFPDLGIKSRAKKGSAILFYNLYRNGTGNWLTRHASCPILYGQKWIAVQWVGRNEQEFAYPCSLHQWE